MNYGIVMSCLCVGIVLNTIGMWIFYQERINYKHALGMVIIISSISFLSIQNNESEGLDTSTNNIEHDTTNYKLIAIALALTICFVNFLRNMQAKYLFRRFNYQPMDLIADSGLICSLILLLCSCYFFFEGTYDYTLNQMIITFIASAFYVI